MSKCHPETPFFSIRGRRQEWTNSCMWFEKPVCLLDVVAARYCSTFICGVTGRWALWWERLMAHLHPTNHSCPQSNVCRTKGRYRERGKCLSCAGRYQPNRKRCLPLRAVMMMIMSVCVCLCVCVWVCIVSGDKSVCALLHFLFVFMWKWKCLAIKQVLRPGRWVMRNTFGKCAHLENCAS